MSFISVPGTIYFAWAAAGMSALVGIGRSDSGDNEYINDQKLCSR